MRLPIALLALCLLAFAACGDASETPADDANVDPNGGKTDDIGDGECSLEDGADRFLNQFVLNDHIQFRCSGPEGFVESACCAEEVSDYIGASGCPPQAKWNDGSGTQRRCVVDDATSEGGSFVPTACCEPLCDADATFRDQANGQACVTGDGQFENNVCCLLKDQAVCEASEFDTSVSDDGRRHCRDANTGRFAPAGCCIDDCFDIITSGEDIPVSCLEAVEDECEGASVDGAGLCRNADNGQFVKAACCDLGAEQGIAADDAFLCEEVNDDVIRCQVGDDDACDRSSAAIDQIGDACCALERDDTFEYCF